VYARSTTILANPSAIDEGVAHVRDEVLPALGPIDGFIGLSMMVDRDSGRCIATSAWQDEATMRASANQVQPIRNGVAEILGGAPDVAEWEITVMHREHPTHDGACVRVSWLQADPAKIADISEYYRTVALPQIEEMHDFCSSSLLVNRGTGMTVPSTSYENRSALEASRGPMDQARNSAASQFGATIREVTEFDLVLAHLHVPEMA
jgi:hypothetical protein